MVVGVGVGLVWGFEIGVHLGTVALLLFEVAMVAAEGWDSCGPCDAENAVVMVEVDVDVVVGEGVGDDDCEKVDEAGCEAEVPYRNGLGSRQVKYSSVCTVGPV